MKDKKEKPQSRIVQSLKAIKASVFKLKKEAQKNKETYLKAKGNKK